MSLHTLQEQAEIGIGSFGRYSERAHNQQETRHISLDVGESPFVQGPENRVHYYRMKNLTLSAEERLIEQARLVARSRHTTLNAAFREWLRQYAGADSAEERYRAVMGELKQVDAGRRFSRDELNER